MNDADDHVLSAQLMDEITEAVVKPTDPRVRAKVITELVHEVDEAVKWRHQLHPDGQEERSLTGLVDAAQAHQQRMDSLGDDVDGEGGENATGSAPRRRAPRGGATAI